MLRVDKIHTYKTYESTEGPVTVCCFFAGKAGNVGLGSGGRKKFIAHRLISLIRRGGCLLTCRMGQRR